MATTFYLRSESIAANSYRFASLARSPDVLQTNTITTVAGATWISLGFWATRGLEPFTLAGSISANLWGLESNAQANASLGVRVYDFDAVSGLSSQIVQLSSATELGTAAAVRTMSATPPSTTIPSNTLLVFEVGAINIGSMGGNRTVSFNYDGPTAGANGDSYVTITENVVLRNRERIFG